MEQQHTEPQPEPEAEPEADWRGWVPYRVRFRDGVARTTWAFLGQERLTDPFLHHTVARLESREGWPARRTSPTPVALFAAAASLPGLAPDVFVLHCSRCGSTLLCNALRAVPTTSVVAEPGAVNDLLLHLLASDSATSPDARVEAESLLQPLCQALGYQRLGDEQRVVMKLSSWNVLALRSQLVRAWPTVPWIFVFRDPVEVSVSQLRDPSGWMSLRSSNPSAAARMFGVQESVLADTPPEQWCAIVLRKFYEAVSYFPPCQVSFPRWSEFSSHLNLAFAPRPRSLQRKIRSGVCCLVRGQALRTCTCPRSF